MPRKSDSSTLKDALTNRDITDIRSDISKLADNVTKGFDGVHQRQDMTNGKVLKAGSDIVENKTQLDKQIESLKAEFKYNRIIWYMLTVCVSVIIALGSYIVLKH